MARPPDEKSRRPPSPGFKSWPRTGSIGQLQATIDDRRDSERPQRNPRLNLTGQGYCGGRLQIGLNGPELELGWRYRLRPQTTTDVPGNIVHSRRADLTLDRLVAIQYCELERRSFSVIAQRLARRQRH